MPMHGSILLTGATGFLGRYLLRDLLVAGHPVVVLARGLRGWSATERVAEIVAFWSEWRGQALPMPSVVSGELGPELAGLSLADRNWLRKTCRTVLHAAANLSFHSQPDGEPWRSNVSGTAALFDLGRDLGIAGWHQVSTAYVCGRRQGPIREEDLDCGQEFHNPYEESKLEAEKLLHRYRGDQPATIYRPAVIVGDSGSGYTSTYSGFYRFLEVGARLAAPALPNKAAKSAPRDFPLRLAGTGDEPCYLVPVDWVSRAITSLLSRPACHGRTFHLLPARPIPARLIQETAAKELNLQGIEWNGPSVLNNPTRIEQLFEQALEEYWPYLRSPAEFSCANTMAALPDLPAPHVDRPMLQRLIRFAMAQNWRKKRSNPICRAGGAPECRTYFEEVFPQQARDSRLGRAAGLNLTVAVDITGVGGGQWSCCWRHGELIHVQRGMDGRSEVVCRLDAATFATIIRGQQPLQQAFFDERIHLSGNVETGLKLAILFEQFLSENPHPSCDRKEARHAGLTAS